MGKIFGLIFVLVFWQSSVIAEVRIQVLDKAGNPVVNAVVSLINSERQKNQPSSISSASEQVAVMDQVDKQFLPQVLLVKAGQAVIFPNSDQVRHHVYSFSKPNDFEIRLYSGDQAESLKFEHPGVVVLGCNIHDQMVGFLYVHHEESTRLSDQSGLMVFDDSFSAASKEQVVSVWHSQLSSNQTDRITQVLKERNQDGVWIIRLDLIPEVKKVSRKFKPRY